MAPSPQRKIFLTLFSLAILGSIAYFESKKPERSSGGAVFDNIIKINPSSMRKETREEKLKKYPLAREISTPDGFINIDKISIGEFVGKKVVLLDIWTYSCINCQRTIPYLNAWHEKYKDKGLIIIGLHTPEFEFEKKYSNVLAAVKKFDIQYPIVLDNDFSTWQAYRNQYWPRKYLIDIDGFVVYDHIGEGGYEETERKIQELLTERAGALDSETTISTDIVRPADAESVSTPYSRSPETYFGAGRNASLANGTAKKEGIQTIDTPESVIVNNLYLAGEWNFDQEYAENKSKDAHIIFKYRGKKVFFVARSDVSITARILIDGSPIGARAGSDVKNGTVTITEDRLYAIVDDAEYGEHTLEIIIENPGLQAFTFTFG